MFKSTWLFSFTSYSYCQGTKDTNYGGTRLISTSLPCEEWEARVYLIQQLEKERIEFDKDSIECLNVNVTNS